MFTFFSHILILLVIPQSTLYNYYKYCAKYDD